MLHKLAISLTSAFFGTACLVSVAFAQQKTTTSTTTVETTQKTPATGTKAKRSAKPVETTAVSTSTTTVVEPPPPKEVMRTVYDEETLKKMKEKLCTDGFKAYVGAEDKNVCKGMAGSPDIAYSCVWDKDGPQAFAPTPQGPCNLDYTEHRGNMVIKKDQFKDNPPLPYGKEAQCCYRAAKGLESAAVTK